MLVSVAIRPLSGGHFEASAPDFPGCALTDSDPDNAFARLRLVIEGALADRYLAGQDAPALRTMAEWRKETSAPATRWREVHINVPHIVAVARHQQGRG